MSVTSTHDEKQDVLTAEPVCGIVQDLLKQSNLGYKKYYHNWLTTTLIVVVESFVFLTAETNRIKRIAFEFIKLTGF